VIIAISIVDAEKNVYRLVEGTKENKHHRCDKIVGREGSTTTPPTILFDETFALLQP
jgi:hypothetical protein